MKVVLVNDCSSSMHFGCVLVTQTYKEQFERVGIELIGIVPWGPGKRELNTYTDYAPMDKADLVIVNGEGSIHHNLRNELIEVAERWPSILMNCVYDGNDKHPALSKFKKIAARESLSVEQFKRHGIDAELIPEIMFTSSIVRELMNHSGSVKKGDLLITDGMRDRAGAMIGVKQSPITTIKRFREYNRVCTGRFHGVVLCAAFGIPFTAWESNTHKIQGIMTDMDAMGAFAERKERALTKPFKPRLSVTSYVCNAIETVNKYFESLHDIG